jgi:transcriptional regulator with XRE-family HTH domain
MAKKSESTPPIGEFLRHRRVEDLHRGLREMAKLLGITPPHLTDIEKGRRSPSEDLLMRISRTYDIDEAALRAGWSKPQAIVGEVASQDPVTAEKVPEFLREARNLTTDQWNKLIRQARRMTDGGE